MADAVQLAGFGREREVVHLAFRLAGMNIATGAPELRAFGEGDHAKLGGHAIGADLVSHAQRRGVGGRAEAAAGDRHIEKVGHVALPVLRGG